ncbi:MAG: hypothetical protein QOK47_1555, partial [Actinomycetota bacterium]|nr:hypothetical protein [Actinomycetota bacterium]
MATALKRAGAGWGLNLLALLLGGAIGVYGVIALTDHLSAPQSQAQTEQPSEGDEPSAPRVAKAAPTRMDPRRGGLEVGLGEWALTPEADVIRPGRVTFVISNHGTMAHGFEIKLEGDSSGHGSGDLLKAESRLLQPGESTRLTVSLDAAFYEIECLVDGHDDMGMQGVL